MALISSSGSGGGGDGNNDDLLTTITIVTVFGQTDMEHWSKFAAFAPLKAAVSHNGGRDLNLDQLSHTFMRWYRNAAQPAPLGQRGTR